MPQRNVATKRLFSDRGVVFNTSQFFVIASPRAGWIVSADVP